MFVDLKEKPWQLLEPITADEFLIGMSSLGHPTQVSVVGNFTDDPTIRIAHRDVDQPFHRDGIYTEAVAAIQGGNYVEAPNVDVVGMYCVQDDLRCSTLFSLDGLNVDFALTLRAHQAIVWDNRLWHGRRGPIGNRLLVRFWTTLSDRSILSPFELLQV